MECWIDWGFWIRSLIKLENVYFSNVCHQSDIIYLTYYLFHFFNDSYEVKKKSVAPRTTLKEDMDFLQYR